MKEKLKNKKVVYTIIGIVSVLLVALAVTYAYWLVTKTQTGENEITAGCLDISINGEKNDITLTNQFPMSDEDGMKLIPYEFTVTNNCNTSVDYQVALEAIGDSSNALSATSLKVALNDEVMLLGNRGKLATTINESYESRSIGYGTLSASGTEGSSDTYSLRIWIDADAPISEMNKTFKSKISVTIGQGIESPYKEGTLAYSLLADYGGANAASEIDSAWIEGTYENETYLEMMRDTSYYWGTEMNFNETNGKYKLGGTIVQATVTECRDGQKSDGTAISCLYTYRTSDDVEYETTSGYKVTSLTNSNETDSISAVYITVQKTGTATNAFSKVTTASDASIYKTQDDLGNSYYYRGNVTNNYVEFGTYAEDLIKYRGYYSSSSTSYKEYETLEECNASTSFNYNCEEYIYAKANDPMYWRIVRINGDGTIRLVYDGTTKAANGTKHAATIGYSVYNTNSDNEKYVGYTYDTSDANTTQVDSTIKGALDTWYDTHLETIYGSYIADGIFCNDREATSYYDVVNGVTTTTKPAGEYLAYYGAYQRLRNDKAPSLRCANQNDRYTVDDTTNGNGLLKNPVGLITADEAFMAGGSTSNNTYYLYSGEVYWTSSPMGWYMGNAEVFYIVSAGNVSNGYVSDNGRIRPVINLKSDIKFTGDGTIDNPYKIVTE